MSLWSLLGGAAKGFGEEGKYLDQQAARARQEALQTRHQLAQEAQASTENEINQKKLEHQIKMEQLSAKHESDLVRYRHEESMAERKNEADRLTTQVNVQEKLFKFMKENPEFYEKGGSLSNSQKKFLSGMPEKKRMLWEGVLKLVNTPLQMGETLEQRLEQTKQVPKTLSDLFPNDPELALPKSVNPLTDLMKNVQYQDEALMKWKGLKASDPDAAAKINEQEFLNAVKTQLPKRPGGKRSFIQELWEGPLPTPKPYGPQNRPTPPPSTRPIERVGRNF